MTSATRLRAVAALAVLALGATLAAPAAAQAPATTAGRAVPGPTSYAGKGPHAVGERTLKLPSGAKVEVWYPARKKDVKGKPAGTYDVVEWLPDLLKSLVPKGKSVTYPSGGVRRVPVAKGRYPLVVFSHGFAGFRDQSTNLTSRLASWGFVVAAPDHLSRNLTAILPGGTKSTVTDVEDLEATITLIGKQNKTKKGWLRKHVDMSRIGAVGHSAGGRAVENLALADRRVDTFIGLAGASTGALDEEATAVPTQPGMLIAGGVDGIVGLDRLESAYDAMAGPKRFVVIGNAGHLAFSDLCEVGAGQGGLLAIGDLLGVPIPDSLRPLATDGCLDPAHPATEAWPAIRHTVVAQLRHVLGLDASDAALTGLTDAYPGIVTDSRVG